VRGGALALLASLLVAVALPAGADEPVRVATLLPWVADALERVPEHARVVASVRRDLHEPTPEGVVDLGNPHSPSFEKLAVARPTLAIGDASLHASLRDGLARSGAEVLLVDTSGVEETWAALREIGRRVGAADEMAAAVEEAQGELERLALERPVSALALFGAPGSFYAISERAWLGDLMAHLRFENVTAGRAGDDRFPGLVPLNDEVVATLRPDVLLLVTHGDPSRIRQAFRERVERGGPWRSVRESAGAGVHVLPPRLFAAHPGLALPEAARALVEMVDDAAADADVAAGSGAGS